MDEVIKTIQELQDTPVPNLLVIIGAIFVFLAFVGKIGTIILLSKERQQWFGIIGAVMLFSGIGMYLFPNSNPAPIPTLISTPISPIATATEPPSPLPTSVQIDLSLTETPTVTQIPLPGEILFQEEFQSNQNDWLIGNFTDENSARDFQITNDGKYRISTTSKQEYVYSYALIPKLSVQNFLLTFDTTLVEPSDVFTDVGHPAIRIEFRKKATDTFYLVYFSDNGSKVWVSNEGEWEVLRDWKNEGDIFIEKNVTRSFSVLAEDSTFVLSVDGKQLAVVDDNTLSGSGEISIGFVLWFENQTATFEFDNIVVKRIP